MKAIAIAAALLLGATAASAEVSLSINDGRVTLVATNATAQQILTEWARVGQTKIVNVERIPGGPLTLQLTAVPEAEALDLLLRSVTGYMAAERPAAGPSNVSRYDRILVLPTAAVARVPVTAPATPVFQQPMPIQRGPVDTDSDEGPSVVPPRGPLFPIFQSQPQIVNPEGEPIVIDQRFAPQPAAISATPGGTAVGAPRPGMIVQPPAPVAPGGFFVPGQPTAEPPEN